MSDRGELGAHLGEIAVELEHIARGLRAGELAVDLLETKLRRIAAELEGLGAD